MGRVTIKGLLAHKLRFALTALAVMLGVAFMSGTMVLTDTISRDVRRPFRRREPRHRRVHPESGVARRARSAAIGSAVGSRRRWCPRSRASRASARVEGNLQFYAQLVDKKGDAIGTPGQGAPTFGFNWVPDRRLNPYRLEPGSRAPQGTDEVVIDAGSAKDGRRSRSATGSRSSPRAHRRSTRSSASPSSATPTAPPGRPPPSSIPRRAVDHRRRRPVRLDRGRRGRRRLAGDGQAAHHVTKLDNRTYQVLTGEEITEENQNDIQDALSFFNIALIIFALIALFVGSFIIFNTFSIVVAQRIREMARCCAPSARAVGRSWSRSLVEAVLVGLFASRRSASVAGILLSTAAQGFARRRSASTSRPAARSSTARTVIVALRRRHGRDRRSPRSFRPARPLAFRRSPRCATSPSRAGRIRAGASLIGLGITRARRGGDARRAVRRSPASSSSGSARSSCSSGCSCSVR